MEKSHRGSLKTGVKLSRTTRYNAAEKLAFWAQPITANYVHALGVQRDAGTDMLTQTSGTRQSADRYCVVRTYYNSV